MNTIDQNFRQYNIKNPKNLSLKEYPFLKYILIANTEKKLEEKSNWYLSFEKELIEKEPS